MINDLNFPTPRIGYGVGGSFNDGFTLVAKTEDGGATWRVIFASTELAPATGVVFQDENHGVVRLKGGGAIFSADGGRTWQGATGTLPGNPRFADPRVGLSCYSYTCSFTVDGGLHWVSQNLALPASIEEFSLPRRDRAYVVGGHGMIYHYRTVPAEYAAKGIVDAPLLPAYGNPLRGHLDQMRNQVGALQAKLSSAGAASGVAGVVRSTQALGRDRQARGRQALATRRAAQRPRRTHSRQQIPSRRMRPGRRPRRIPSRRTRARRVPISRRTLACRRVPRCNPVAPLRLRIYKIPWA